MQLPAAYAWLAKSLAANDGHPMMVDEAVRLYGTHEGDGVHCNPIIMGWVNEIAALPGKSSVKQYTNDHTQAWCGLFMAHCAHVAGKDFPSDPLWALNWQMFGSESPKASFGDVLVFERRDAKGKLIGGHVGMYAAEDGAAFHVLGGNESNQVNIICIAKNRLRACRRPIYNIPPANVQTVIVAADGSLGRSEV